MFFMATILLNSKELRLGPLGPRTHYATHTDPIQPYLIDDRRSISPLHLCATDTHSPRTPPHTHRDVCYPENMRAHPPSERPPPADTAQPATNLPNSIGRFAVIPIRCPSAISRYPPPRSKQTCKHFGEAGKLGRPRTFERDLSAPLFTCPTIRTHTPLSSPPTDKYVSPKHIHTYPPSVNPPHHQATCAHLLDEVG